MRTLRARAGELEQDFPFGIVRQLFEASLAGPARAELLSGAAELAGPLFDLRGSGELPAPDPAYSTLHGLYWLTVNYLEIEPARPVLLSVDDLHWCDGVDCLTERNRRTALDEAFRRRSQPAQAALDEAQRP